MIQRRIAGTQAVERALALLKTLADDRPTWRLGELAEATGLHKATAHRLLGALEREGMVTHDARGTHYRLGPEAVALGSRRRGTHDLRTLCRPVLERLAGDSGETATLEVLAGSDVLVLDEVPGGGVIGASADVGTRWPAHTTSTGKALLAALPPARRPALQLVRVTPRTLTSSRTFTADLARTARRGYGVAREELAPGYVAVGAAVLDREGAPVGALSVGGPRSRFPAPRVRRLGDDVRAAAAGVSRALGYQC